jgi:SAM-dependent methyltransferase
MGRDDADIETLHRNGQYSRPRPAVDRLLEPLRRLADRATLSALGEVPPGKTVLELGAGDGRLLALLRGHGCIVEGVDAFADEAPPGVPMRRERLEDVQIPPQSVDLVVLWHVLEHLEDPAGAVELAARALRPGGRLVVSAPALDSIQARIGGDRWFHLDVPRHAVHFTRAGLISLIERCGLRASLSRRPVLDQNLLGMTQTLLNRLTYEPNVAFRALKGDRTGIRPSELVVSAVAAPPIALGGSLAELLAILSGRGGVAVVHAVRGVP